MQTKIKIENPNKDSLQKYFTKNASYLMKCFVNGQTTPTETTVCFLLKALKKEPTVIKSRLQYSLLKHSLFQKNVS